MPASVTAVRAFLVGDAQGHPLPSPQPVDLAHDTIPHGATVRFEVEVASQDPVLPMRAWLQPEGRGGYFIYLFPSPDGGTFVGEVRLPWGLMVWGREVSGVDQPPRFPLEGVPPFGEGEYTVGFWLRNRNRELLGESDLRFRLGAPPPAGGAPPRIVSVHTGLTDSRVRVGQPWLLTAQVDDPDDDVLVVVFSVHQGDFAQWLRLVDDGRCGDERAYDGVHSFLRIGGDMHERPELAPGKDAPVTLSVQAGDLRGNWSDPVVVQYQISGSEAPLWMEEPSPDGPNILEAGLSEEEGTIDQYRLWARCDSRDAWVCGSVVGQGEVFPLFDDGKGPDAVAGDGIYSDVLAFPRDRYRDVVLYGVAKSGPLRIGRKVGVRVRIPASAED